MKSMRQVAVAALVMLLAGCEPAQYQLDVRSPRRVDETITAVVPPANAELVEPMLATVLGDGWRVRKATGSDGIHLTFTRRRTPAKDSGLELTRTVTGPVRLRYEYRLTMTNPLSRIANNEFLKTALANQVIPVTARVRMPGGLVDDSDGNQGSISELGEGVWTVQLSELSAKPATTLVAVSRPWRFGLLLLWALVALMILYVVGPELIPSPEKRRAAAERREAKRQAKAAKAARKAAKVKPAKEPKAPKQPKPGREKPVEPEAEAVAVEPEPEAVVEPEPVLPVVEEPAPVADAPTMPAAPEPAALDQGRMLFWRGRRNQIQQRRRRGVHRKPRRR